MGCRIRCPTESEEEMKYSVRRLERQLGVSDGLLRNWIMRGNIPLPMIVDNQIYLSPQHEFMLLAVISFFKVHQKNFTGKNGMGTAPTIACYWGNLEECFRFLRIAKKEYPEAKVEGWTYLKNGIPIVTMTRGGAKPDRLAMNLGESLKTMRKELKKETLAEVHHRYDLQKV